MNAFLTAMVNGGLLGVAVTLAVWLVLRLALGRVLNAATRYVVWWATLVLIVLLPLLFLPVREKPGTDETLPRRAPLHANPLTIAAPRGQFGLSPAFRPVSRFPETFTPPRQSPKPRPQLRVEIRWTQWLLAAWLLSAALLLGRLALSWLLLQRHSARAFHVPPEIQSRCAQWLATVGARRRDVRVAGSLDLATPVAVGPRQPSILIPAQLLDALDPDELDQIGLHEAAHLARWDDYALLVQRTLEALFALHPVVRWIARQIDLEREIACDDRVIASLGRPLSYATCLTRVVELSGSRRSLVAAAAAEDRSHLARRVDMLLDRARHTGTRLLTPHLALAVTALAGMAWAAGHMPELVTFATPLIHAIRSVPVRQILPPVLTMAPQAQETAQGFEGQVLEDSTGNPLVSAELRFHKAGWRELAADLETGRDGRVRAVGLDSGDYTVDVAKPNFVTVSLDVHLPNDSFLVRLVRYAAISGEVRNAQGQPLAGRILSPGGRTTGSARVCLLRKSPDDGQLLLVDDETPAAEGRYRIQNVPPGEYAIALYYNGLPDGSGIQFYPDTAHPRFLTVAGGEEYRDVNFTVAGGSSYRVSGKVALPKPSDEFTLALGLPEQPMLPFAKALTEKGGVFHFEKVPPGSYDLFVAGPTEGYGAYDSMVKAEALYGRMRVQVGAQDVDGLEIAVAPGPSLPVILRGQGNGPVPEGCSPTARVTAEPLEPWGVMMTHNSTQATVGKEATVPNLPPGRFRVNASNLGANCYQVERPVADLSGGNPGPVAVELAAAGSIRGSLRPVPERAAGYLVVLLESTGSETARLAHVDSQGHFLINGLRPGRYRISAQSPQDAPKARWVGDVTRMIEIEIRGGSPTDLELPVVAKGGGQ
jgi:beta-lactamase regulating signal transducer with metallopeptidase domain